MSDFCDFVPDDPSCQPDPVPVDPVGPADGGDGGDMMDDDMDKDMGMDYMMANITFLMVPLMIVVQKAAWTYRYSSVVTDADVGETASDTNYFSYLSMASNYWTMTTHLILVITQLLSMVAGMAEINMMAWMYVNLANMVVMGIMGMAYVYVYNMYWTIAEDADSSAAEITDAALALSWMKRMKTVEMAFKGHYMLALYKHHKHWMMAQWMSLDEETKAAWMEKHEMDKEDHDMDDMDEDDMYALFGF